MIKYARKIKDKKRKKKSTSLRKSRKVGDWDFTGYMPTGEPIWHNSIDDYTLIMHIN